MHDHDNEKAAAAYMGVSTATLRKRRHLGRPPAFIRIGRKVVYSRSAIDQFLSERTVEPNSAQQRADDTSDQPREGAVR